MLGHDVQPVTLAWPKAPKYKSVARELISVSIFNGPGPFVVDVPDIDADLLAMRQREHHRFLLQGRLRALKRIHGYNLAQLDNMLQGSPVDLPEGFVGLHDRFVSWALKTLQEAKACGLREFLRD